MGTGSTESLGLRVRPPLPGRPLLEVMVALARKDAETLFAMQRG